MAPADPPRQNRSLFRSGVPLVNGWRQVAAVAMALACIAFASPAHAAKNKPPKAVAGFPTAEATEGALFGYVAPAFLDPEGGVVTYTASGQPSWLTFYPVQRAFNGTPPYTETVARKTKKYKIKVTATDPLGKSASKSFSLKINDAVPGSPPPPPPPVPSQVVLAIPLADVTVDEDSAFTYWVPTGAFVDVAGRALTYSFSGLPDTANVQEGAEAAFWWGFGPPQSMVGTTQVTVTATDSAGHTLSDSFAFTVINQNDAPRPADWHLDFEVTEEVPFRLTVPAEYFIDDDGDPITYSASEFQWFHFDPATREIRGVLAESSIVPAAFHLTATDPSGAYGSTQVNISIIAVNDAPRVLTPLADVTLFAGQPLDMFAVFVDPESQPQLIRTAIGVPPWATFNENGTLRGTPGPDDSGTWQITFTATDPQGASGSDVVLVTVIADNHPPQSPGHIWFPYATEGEPYSHSFADDVFTDADGDALTLSVIAAPEWLAFDAATRTFSGTPPEGSANSHFIKLSATDPDGAKAFTDSYLLVRTLDEIPTGTAVLGSIRPQAHSTVDGDTNDPNAPLRTNDGPDQAQSVPFLPAILNGFVTSTGTGLAGDRFAAAPDLYDTYRFQLKAGDLVALQISDYLGSSSSEADLDLVLEDPETLDIVAFSAGVGPGELLSVPHDGYFNVVVVAWNGRSNYVLEAGAGSAAALASKAVDDRAEFVPGEAIVRYRADGRLLKRGRPTTPAPTLVRLDGVTGAGKPGDPALGAWRGVPIRNLALREKLETIRAAKRLGLDPMIASVDLNFLRHATATASDPLRAAQWHYDAINLDRAWDLSRGADNVVVAVIDTGVMLSHPDLAANLVAGYDFISSPTRARDGDGIDPNPDDPGDGALAGQGSFHGTHVAGTVSATADNGIGGSGVAPGVRIMPLRVLGGGGGTSYDVLQAVRYAAGLANASGSVPPAPVDVINLSLGGGGFSNAEQEAYSAARAAGVIVVAAAGNESTTLPSYPASYEGVVSVSATDLRRGLAPYSNSGIWIDVAAPGGDSGVDADGDGRGDGVLSTHAIASGGHRTATYQYLQGTSMATPHVAGVVALMRSIHPALTPGEFDDELRAGRITDDLGGDGATTRNDSFGWGFINAAAATARAHALANVQETPTFLVTDPTSIVLPTLQDQAIVRVTRNGPANASILSVVSSNPALSVVTHGVDALGFGFYRLAVNRASLVPGTHAFTIDFQSDLAGAARVWVYVEVPPPTPIDLDNGFHYVLLVDPVSFEVVAQSVAFAFQSLYRYSFLEVPAGEYYLVAGTDHDNDFYICDAGESCGASPSLSQPERIVVTGTEVVVPEFGTAVQQSVGGSSVSPAVQARTPTGILRRTPEAPPKP